MIPGVIQPIIDLTEESQEAFQPLCPNLVEIKLEEETVLKREGIEEQDKGKELFSRPLAETEFEWYPTRTGRTVNW